jgi:protein TonB
MKQLLLKHATKIMGGIFMLCFVTFAAYFVSSMTDNSPKKPKKQVQQISLVKPPPPPPKQEKLPEPEMKQEKTEIEQPMEEMPEDLPEMADDAPPAGDTLGLDAEGGAGGDSFGLVGRKGGRGLLAGDPYAYFAGTLQDVIQDLLLENKKVRSENYSIVVKVWVSPYGSVERVKLARSTGNTETDAAIKQALSSLSNLSHTPPEGMPQPIKLRITSRL